MSISNTVHLDQHESELDALQKICEILSTHSDQRKLFRDILNVMVKELGYHRPTIMLLSADGQELSFEAAGQSQVIAPNARYSRGEGITGQVLQSGKPAIVPRISQEPQFKDRIHQRKKTVRNEFSFICTPICLEGEVIGTLSVDLVYSEAQDLGEAQRVVGIIASLIANDVKTRRLGQMQQEALREENRRLRGELAEVKRPENLIGNSSEMRVVYQKIDQVSKSDTTVMIRGESGTGKELVASAIHYSSVRAEKPFVKVNCAALSETLLESELFGHEKGAFTGALSSRIGRMEQAECGTLFLDEIGDFSPAVQVKLLRVLQEFEYERVGSNQPRKADVRIIVATNRDLEADCETGRFRMDLYYRINVFPIYLPALRDRRNDILVLTNHFVEKYSKKMGKPVSRISTNAISMLMAYHWPGNVRELENCIEYSVLVATDDVISGATLPPTLQLPGKELKARTGLLKQQVQMLEKDMIIDSLKRHDGNVRLASEELGITSRMVRYKIENLGINYQKYFPNQ